jgi:hypothetical protein
MTEKKDEFLELLNKRIEFFTEKLKGRLMPIHRATHKKALHTVEDLKQNYVRIKAKSES